MTQDEIIRMAREAGLNIPDRRNDLWMPQLERFAALVAAHEREKQAEQEPVAWAMTSESGEVLDCISNQYKVTQPCTVDYDEPLYAAPLRTKDLTDDEITNAWESMGRGFGKYTEFARAVIAADREKNK